MGPDRNKTRLSRNHQTAFLARRCQTSQTQSCRHFSSPTASLPDNHWISGIVSTDLHGQNVKANKRPAMTSAPGTHSIGDESAAGVTSTRPFARNRIMRGTGLRFTSRQVRQRAHKIIPTIGSASQDHGLENHTHQLRPSSRLASAETPIATKSSRRSDCERSATIQTSIPRVLAGFTHQPYQTRASTKEPFVPPKPNEFLRATLIGRSRATFAQ